MELSDVPTEPYGSESDSQNDVVTTRGKFIISRSDKVEISLEYQCSTSLPEATNEGTGSTVMVTPTVTLSDDTTTQFPDETRASKSPNALLDETFQNENVLPDETNKENSVLLRDRSKRTDVTRQNQQQK